MDPWLNYRHLFYFWSVVREGGIDVWSLDALEIELGRARVVASERVPPTVVTMNSRARLRDLESGAVIAVSLVFPAGQAANESSVPVLSPLGLALLGCREGDVMEWRTEEGLRRLCIDGLRLRAKASSADGQGLLMGRRAGGKLSHSATLLSAPHRFFSSVVSVSGAAHSSPSPSASGPSQSTQVSAPAELRS